MQTKDLTLLGKQTEYKQDYAPEVLEAFENKHPDNDYWVTYDNETVLFDENYYYEYIYDLNLDVSKLKIKECYMKVKFENKCLSSIIILKSSI